MTGFASPRLLAELDALLHWPADQVAFEQLVFYRPLLVRWETDGTEA